MIVWKPEASALGTPKVYYFDGYTRTCVYLGSTKGTNMQRRINVSLSEEAVRLLDRLAPKGDRSRFLDQLVKRTAHDRMELRARLKERAIRRADLDRQAAADWDPLADEVWRKLGK